MWDRLLAALASWHQGKLFIERSVAIDHDTLHLMAGLILWLLIALVARRVIVSWLPLLLIFGLALINETADLALEVWPDIGMQFGEGAKDVFLTMFVPTVLFIAGRFVPRLFAVRPSQRTRL
jgi:hypothetical protein